MAWTSQEPDGSGQRHRHDHHTAGLAVMIMLVQVVGTTLTARGQVASLDPLGYALLAIGALILVARRSHPVATLVITAAATVTYQALDYPRGPTVVALIIAAVVAVKAGRRYPAWGVATVTYAAWLLLTGPALQAAVGPAAWGVGILLAAEWIRVAGIHRARAAEMHREKQRLREEQRRRQSSEERLRIARELHDVLGHHLSLINVQAGVGLHLMDRQPDQARAALGTIKQASAEALREVRSVLAALNPQGETAPRTPAPQLSRLADLTDDAGLPVHTTVSGQPRPLPAELDRAAYRIVQEALTNVRRHAGAGAAVSVTIEYGQDELVVRVEDDGGEAGPVTEPITPGNGLGGMRERAAALGGSLTAAPRPGGGFGVRARLPLPAAEPGGVA